VVGVIAAVVVVVVPVVEVSHEASEVVLEGLGQWVVVVRHQLGRHSRQPCAAWSAVIQLHRRHHPAGLLTVHITRWSLPAFSSQLAALQRLFYCCC